MAPYTTYHYYTSTEDWKDIPKLYPFAFYPGDMINPQLLELPMIRTSLYGSKDVWVIEIQLYKGVSTYFSYISIKTYTTTSL